MKNEHKLVLLGVGLLVGGAFLYYLATSVIPRTLVTFTKAAPATKVSFATSLVLGQKILARADGREACVVNVFVLDDNGKGVGGKRVDLEAEGAVVRALAETTDKDGKIGFEITSTEEKQYKLTASVEGVPLNRVLTVTFRN